MKMKKINSGPAQAPVLNPHKARLAAASGGEKPYATSNSGKGAKPSKKKSKTIC